MKVCTPDQMREIDRATIEDRGVPGLQLMERAGSGAAKALRDKFGDPAGKTVYVVCGKGNNGGDGFVVARYLREWNAHVRVFSLAAPEDLTGDAAANFKRLRTTGQEVVRLDGAFDMSEFAKALAAADLIVDAIFGTGFRGVPRAPIDAVIDAINRAPAPAVALDVPSGVNGETGSAEGVAVDADLTPTFGLPKLGLLLYPGRSLAGDVAVIDLEFPHDIIDAVGIETEITMPADVRVMLPMRRQDAHKGDCGRVLVIGGSVGFTGAVSLAADAALRSGAGLVTAAVPASLNDIMEVKLTEAMTLPLQESADRALAADAAHAALSFAAGCHAVVLGPGLSRTPDSAECARRLGTDLAVPTVIDADGLNAFEGRPGDLSVAKGVRILTPHPGEAARLLGRSTADVVRNRLAAARAIADITGAVVVLKGAPTVVCDETGALFINPTGNAGLATGGTGDVLSGLIGGLLGQGCAPCDAARLGVYLHGLAGDVGAAGMGAWGLIAGDLIDLLPNSMMMIEEGGVDELWIR